MNMSEFDDAYDDQQRIRGAILETPISDLPLRDPILVSATSTVADAVKSMNENHTGCVLVGSEGKLIGIFTERDVLTKDFFRTDSHTVAVESVMTKNPETLEADDSIAFALNKMSVGGYRHIPIMQGGRPVGVLSVRDIVDFLVDLFPEDVLNLPPSPTNAITNSIDGG
ncbi:MAG: cyclic nucleotide-binding/CBS domain-containing protein [Planctomycetaceae bacterium]